MSLRLSGGRRLRSPPGEGTRPTTSRVRLAVMNLLAAELPGCRWLDLCCGSGVMACEALQRGAREVVAVERNRRIAAVALSNLRAVAEGLEIASGEPPARVEVVVAEVLAWLGRPMLEGQRRDFDLIYVDPPYATGLYGGIADLVRSRGWLRDGGTMVWECDSEHLPELPVGWSLADRRRYGGSSVLLLN